MEQVEHNEPVRGHPIGRAQTFFNINFINVVGLSHFLTSFKNKCKPQTNLKDKCLQVCQLILASLCRPFFLSAWVTLRCLLLIEKGESVKHVLKDCTNTLALNAQSLISENSSQISINRANIICCPKGILLKNHLIHNAIRFYILVSYELMITRLHKSALNSKKLMFQEIVIIHFSLWGSTKTTCIIHSPHNCHGWSFWPCPATIAEIQRNHLERVKMCHLIFLIISRI